MGVSRGGEREALEAWPCRSMPCDDVPWGQPSEAATGAPGFTNREGGGRGRRKHTRVSPIPGEFWKLLCGAHPRRARWPQPLAAASLDTCADEGSIEDSLQQRSRQGVKRVGCISPCMRSQPKMADTVPTPRAMAPATCISFSLPPMLTCSPGCAPPALLPSSLQCQVVRKHGKVWAEN